MFAQLFGEYLVKHSVIKEDIYRQIIEKQLSVRVRLGTIAVSEGFMTEEQVEEVNELQKAQDKRFGDIAVEKGYLTEDQMKTLLSKQGDSYLQFVQLMTELAGFTQTDVERLVQSFGKDSGFSEEELQAVRADDIDRLIPLYVISSKPYITDIASLIARNMIRFVTRDFSFDRAQHLKEFYYDHLSCQELRGDDSVYVAIAEEADEGGFLKIAEAFSKQEMGSVSAEAYDAVGEFINVINGLFVSEQSKRKVDLDMEPPVSFRKQKVTGDFYLIPFYIEGKKIEIILSVNSEFSAGETPEELKAVTATAQETAPDGKGRGRILIVDDSMMSRTILRNILTGAGYVVVGEAADGEEGVKRYEELKPDLVTLDITMPRVDGLQALTRILEIDPGARAIMITAAGQQDKLINALKSGAKRFINKPFDEGEILRNIGEVI